MATAAATGLFTALNLRVDELVQKFNVDIMQNIITNITPLVVLGMTIYFCIYGWSIINGSVQDSFNALVRKLFKVGLILAIALAGGMYQSHLADIVINLPSDFSKLVLNSPSDTLSVADQMIELGLTKAGEIASEVSIMQPGDSIIKAMVAIFIGFSTIVLGGIGGGLMLVIKIECAIMAAIGPIFIITLLFPAVRQLFSNWLGAIIGYGIFSLLLTVLFIFILKIAKTYIDSINADENIFASSLVFMAFTIVAAYMLKSAKQMAEKLSGVFGGMGVSGQAFDSSAHTVSKGASNFTSNAGKAAGTAARFAGGGVGKGLDKMASASWRKSSSRNR